MSLTSQYNAHNYETAHLIRHWSRTGYCHTTINTASEQRLRFPETWCHVIWMTGNTIPLKCLYTFITILRTVSHGHSNSYRMNLTSHATVKDNMTGHVYYCLQQQWTLFIVTQFCQKWIKVQINIFERRVYRRIFGPVYDNEKEDLRMLTNKEFMQWLKNLL